MTMLVTFGIGRILDDGDRIRHRCRELPDARLSRRSRLSLPHERALLPVLHGLHWDYYSAFLRQIATLATALKTLLQGNAVRAHSTLISNIESYDSLLVGRKWS